MKKKNIEMYENWDELAACDLPCGCLVKIRYSFGNPVSREHFERFLETYKSEPYYENEKNFNKMIKKIRNNKSKPLGIIIYN